MFWELKYLKFVLEETLWLELIVGLIILEELFVLLLVLMSFKNLLILCRLVLELVLLIEEVN